jgi:DNA-binding NarL/FixJ family response regulator
MTPNDSRRRPAIVTPSSPAPAGRSPEGPLTVIVVDDHLLFRQGMRALLDRNAEIRVVGEAATGEEALRLAKALQPSAVLMDLNLGDGMDGIQATRLIRDACPDTEVVVLSSYYTEEYALPALKAGARGYLVKNTGVEDVVRAVKLAVSGGSLIDPLLTPVIMSEYRRMTGQGSERTRNTGLSERDLALLRLLAAGYNNRQIAEELTLAESTVKNNLSALFQKLGVRDRTQAVLHAIDTGIVEPNPRRQ